MYNTGKKVKRFYAAVLLLVCIVFTSSAPDDTTPRAKYNFNSDWRLSTEDFENAGSPSFDDSNWTPVTLPHAWNENDAFRVPIDAHSTGIAWYRKHFKLPRSARNGKVFLEFEGVRFAAEIRINGHFVARHENGVMGFGIDITPYVDFKGDNLIAVKTDNRWDYAEKSTGETYQWNNKNFNANYGGIPKNVYLHITAPIYQTLPLYSNLETTGTYVYADHFDIPARRADIHVETEVKNESGKTRSVQLRFEVVAPDGQIAATGSAAPVSIPSGGTEILCAEVRAENLHFWSWGYGYLYDVYSTLYVGGKAVDRVKIRTGFRKTAFKNGMIYLNDRVIQVKGYAQRTSNEWPAVGMSVPAWLSDFSNRMMVEGNANLVRWMHVTPWKQDVESCDRVGLMQAMPAGDAEKDTEGRRWEQRKLLMRDAIVYNRNNPSIIFYESGNESISEQHMAEMRDLRDRYDPHGGRAIGSREMLDSKIAEYGGEMLYINKSARHPLWATEYCRDEALRKYWDEYSYPYHKDGDGPLYRNTPAESYNRNQDSYAIEAVTRWYDYYVMRPGSGERVSSGGANIVFSDTNTHFRGAENYRRSGEVDAVRIPKDAYFAHQVMWNGWVDTEHSATYIIGHWNYAPGVVKNIYAVSTGEQVELFLNGKSLGFGERSKNFLFTFRDIAWEAGTLTAVGYDAERRETSRYEIATAGEPYALSMSVQTAPDGFKADGADMALVEVEVTDRTGRRCPLSNALIKFELEGAAEWRGGIAQGADNYILSDTLPVECGVNRVLLRSTRQAGTVKLTALSQGLEPATITFESKPFATEHGLSRYIAADYLPTYLERGETPATPSYTVRRVPVKIASATAGARQENAVASYDDNELTEWGNDGRRQSGWIAYTLEREAVISQIDVKFAGWRTRSYPIRICIDGQEVWSGETARSLGYVTLNIPPTKGSEVKVELIGINKEADAFGGIVEITGKTEPDSRTSDTEAKGSLRIVEIEFYEIPDRP